VTAGIDGVDVMVGEASGQSYQIFQGQMGKYHPLLSRVTYCYLVLDRAINLVLIFVSWLNRQLYKIH
jgi:hypothetical protein